MHEQDWINLATHGPLATSLAGTKGAYRALPRLLGSIHSRPRPLGSAQSRSPLIAAAVFCSLVAALLCAAKLQVQLQMQVQVRLEIGGRMGRVVTQLAAVCQLWQLVIGWLLTAHSRVGCRSVRWCWWSGPRTLAIQWFPPSNC